MTVLIEAPLARMVLMGMERGRAMDMLRQLATCEAAQDEVRRIVGSRIEVSTQDGDIHVESVFALREATVDGDGTTRDDGVYWDNKGVVARGHSLPESAIALAAGCRLDAIIQHPVLEGLHVAWASNEEDGVLIVEASDSLWTVDRIEAGA